MVWISIFGVSTAKSGGSLISGVSGPSTADRSTTSIAARKKLAGDFAEKFLRVHGHCSLFVDCVRWLVAALNILLDENICICNYL